MVDNYAAYAELDAFLDRLRAVEGLTEDAAPDVAKAYKAKVRANVRAQVDPYGHPWKPGDSSAVVLEEADKAVSVRVQGTTIVLELSGVEVRHHVGSARGYRGGSSNLGGFRRPIIPWKSLPGPFKTVTREVLEKRFHEIFGSK
jgi:hypothetical protein